MDTTLKNVAVILVIFTLAFAGYYFFIQKDEATFVSSGSINQDLFADVQKYIGRREILDQVKLDTTIFSDERYNNLIDYTANEPLKPDQGRVNPFDEV